MSVKKIKSSIRRSTLARLDLPLVNIVVPIFNAHKYIKGFLKSYSKIEYPNREVIFIDDGSTDGTVQEIRDFFKDRDLKYQLVQTKSRQGIPKSRNIGIKKSKGAFVAFAEADMQFDRKWIRELINLLQRDPHTGGAFGKIMDYTDRKIFQAAGAMLAPQTGWILSRGVGELDKGQYDKICFSLVTSVGSMIRKEALEKIGGYDSNMSRVDDIDLGWRLWVAGYETLFIPSAIVFHYTSKNMMARKDISVFSQQVDLGKNIKMVFQNYSFVNVVRFFPFAVGMNVLRIFSRFLNGDFWGGLGTLYSIIWFFMTLPQSIKSRKRLQQVRKYSDNYIMDRVMLQSSFLNIYKSNIQPALKTSQKLSLRKSTNVSIG